MAQDDCLTFLQSLGTFSSSDEKQHILMESIIFDSALLQNLCLYKLCPSICTGFSEHRLRCEHDVITLQFLSNNKKQYINVRCVLHGFTKNKYYFVWMVFCRHNKPNPQIHDTFSTLNDSLLLSMHLT